MKKVWKYVISIFLTLILAAGGTIYYFFSVKEYDTEDAKIKEIIETVYDIILPGEFVDEASTSEAGSDSNTVSNDGTNADSTVAVDDNGSTSDSSAASESSEETDENSNTESTNKGQTTTADSKTTNDLKEHENPSNTNDDASSNQEESNPTTPTPPKVTAESIKAKYRPVFESLQSQANGKLDALVGAAISEYKTKQANGESISYAYFFQKYSSAGRALEGKTDAAFYYIYGALENELIQHGLDASQAAEFKQQYAAAKNSREASLLEIAKQGL
jgi:hypothetical protein